MERFKFCMICGYFVFPHNFFIGYELLNGIKPSDIISLVLFCLILKDNFTALPLAFILLPIWYLLRSMLSISSVGYISLAFGFKFIEYLVILYSIAGINFVKKKQLLRIILISTLFFLALESIGIYWGPDWAGRYSAQYGGPYELGAIALLLLYTYKNYFIKIGLFFIIIISEAKATIISLIISYIQVKKINIRRIALILIILLISLMNDRVQDLISTLIRFLDSNIIEILSSVPYSNSKEEYLNNWLLRESFSQDNGLDWSTGSRIYTYILALKSLNVIGIIFGMGPGYYGFAIDSSILRIFVETGIVGIALFYVFFSKIFSNCFDKKIQNGVLLNLFLVDIFFSARFFPLLYLCYCLNFSVGKDAH